MPMKCCLNDTVCRRALAVALLSLAAAQAAPAAEPPGPGVAPEADFLHGFAPRSLPPPTPFAESLHTLRFGSRDAVDENGLVFGPLLQFRSMRDAYAAGESDPSMGYDTAVEGGAYVTLDQGPWSFSSAFASDFSNEHGGTVIDLSLAYRQLVSDNLTLIYGASTSWASDRYLDAFFGDEPDAAGGGGRLAGDLYGIGFQLTAWYRINEHWDLVGVLDADRALGATADRPYFDGLGERHRLRAGGSLNFRF